MILRLQVQLLTVHRDIKPANVLVKGNGIVKIADFGLAKAFDAEREIAGPHEPSSPDPLSRDAAGSRPYMPPEQFESLSKDADGWHHESTGTADRTQAEALQKAKWAELNIPEAKPEEPDPELQDTTAQVWLASGRFILRSDGVFGGWVGFRSVPRPIAPVASALEEAAPFCGPGQGVHP